MYMPTFPLLFCVHLSAATVHTILDRALEVWRLRISSHESCFGDLGCFNLNEPWFSWTRPVPVLPQPPDIIDTKFYLMTRNVAFPQRLTTRPMIDLSSSGFNKSKKVFFIVHGYIAHYDDDWVLDLARALLTRLDANVILVDWANGSNIINYIQAVANGRLVGMETARLINALREENLSDPFNMHGLGFSLGAQVLAYAANASHHFHRITAMDPAQPGFEEAHPMVRLDSSDADFVDVVHTNAVPFLPDLGFGVTGSVGHVDFYMNGGERQPSCGSETKIPKSVSKWEIYTRVNQYLANIQKLNVRVDSVEQLTSIVQQMQGIQQSTASMSSVSSFSILDLLTGAFTELFDYVSCSHQKAHDYFIESLKFMNCSFWGVPWKPHTAPPPVDNCTYDVCSEMGLHSILFPARGNFYVSTNARSPYCSPNQNVEATMTNGLADHIANVSNHDLLNHVNSRSFRRSE